MKQPAADAFRVNLLQVQAGRTWRPTVTRRRHIRVRRPGQVTVGPGLAGALRLEVLQVESPVTVTVAVSVGLGFEQD